MNNIRIRTAKEDDFKAIFQIANNCRPMVSERISIYHIFTKFFQNTVFIAEKVQNNNVIMIGFLIGFISQLNSSECYIHLLCVDPEHRGESTAFNLIKTFLMLYLKWDVKKFI